MKFGNLYKPKIDNWLQLSFWDFKDKWERIPINKNDILLYYATEQIMVSDIYRVIFLIKNKLIYIALSKSQVSKYFEEII